MQLKTNERVMVRVVPRALDGTEVSLDGPVSFVAIPDGHVSLQPIDSTSVWVKGEAAGTTGLYASADADLDNDETRHVEAYVQIEVVNAMVEAETLEVEVGTPEVVG